MTGRAELERRGGDQSGGSPPTVMLLSHLATRGRLTGAERSLVLLASALKRRGHYRPVLVFPSEGAALEQARRESLTVEVQPSGMLWWTSYRSPSVLYALARAARFGLGMRHLPALGRLIKKHDAALVHANTLAHVSGLLAARRAGLPALWHVREILPAGPRRSLYATLARRYAAQMVAVSRAVASCLGDAGLAPLVKTVPNPVEPLDAATRSSLRRQVRREWELPADVPVVGHLGQMLPHKGQLEFLQAARLVLAECPEARFVVMGDLDSDPGYAEQVRRQAASLGGAARLTGYLADAPARLAAMDLTAMTSTVPDPLPRSVLESMAAGVPVVAFRGGGVTDMLEQDHNGRLVPTGDVNALARSMIDLLADQAGRRALAENAHTDAGERFGPDSHAQAIEKLYGEMLRGR